jgi:hypothetical protein
VSAVAQSDFESGREHGEAVSTIARTNGGADATTEGEDEGDDEGDDEIAPEAADQAELGAGNAGEHGRP